MKRKRRTNGNRIVAMLLISTLFLSMTGCIFDRKVDLKKESSYQKWVQELDLSNLECMEVFSYHEEKNMIVIQFEIKSEIEDDSYMAELTELIDKHNAFVEANPDYFKNGTIIDFRAGPHCGPIRVRASSNLHDTRGNRMSYDVRMLKRKTTAQIQYLNVDCEYMKDWLINGKTQIHIPVVLLDMGKHANYSEEYSMESFVSLEQLVVNYDRAKLPESELMQIKEQYPNIEVYSLQKGKDLKKH